MNTIFQDLAIIRDLTGYKPNLAEFESVEKIVFVHDDSGQITTASLLITRINGRASRGRFVAAKIGKEIVSFAPIPNTNRWHKERFILWDDVATEHILNACDDPNAPHDRSEWESLCYRPGNARNPMDNVDRINQGIK